MPRAVYTSRCMSARPRRSGSCRTSQEAGTTNACTRCPLSLLTNSVQQHPAMRAHKHVARSGEGWPPPVPPAMIAFPSNPSRGSTQAPAAWWKVAAHLASRSSSVQDEEVMKTCGFQRTQPRLWLPSSQPRCDFSGAILDRSR